MTRALVGSALLLVPLSCGGSDHAAAAPAASASSGSEARPVDAPVVPAPGPSKEVDAGQRAEPNATPSTATPSFPSSTPGNELTLGMLRALRKEKGNVFFSSTSVRTALGMTALGAKGATLDEMAKALHVSADAAQNVDSAKKETASWRAAAGKAELVIANRLWIEKAFALEPAFTTQSRAGYGASAEEVAFTKAPDQARGKINKWVSDQTKAKIVDLLPAGSITDQTRLVLTNAIYFKGNWAEAFKKDETKDEPFRAPSGTVNVPTMHRTGSFSYAENAEVSLVELPYKESDLALLVALPRKAEQLDAIESEVSGGEVDAWAKSLSPRRVALALPRFTFSWGRSIRPELEQLGIKTAFSPQADFSGLSAKAGKNLFLSDVFHKAFVLVDEVGTEAAAATGAVISVKSLPMTTVMKVDHPFLFFVRNTKTGDILFAGRVANPKA
jgi:serpin B